MVLLPLETVLSKKSREPFKLRLNRPGLRTVSGFHGSSQSYFNLKNKSITLTTPNHHCWSFNHNILSNVELASMFWIVLGENFFLAMSALRNFYWPKKKKKKKKGVATARWQCNTLQEFLTQKKKTMIVSMSETKKEQRKSFVRTEEICEEEREKSVHQKRERVPWRNM